MCEFSAIHMEHLCEMKDEMLDMLCDIHDEMRVRPTCRHIDLACKLLQSIHYVAEIEDMKRETVTKDAAGNVTSVSKKKLVIS